MIAIKNYKLSFSFNFFHYTAAIISSKTLTNLQKKTVEIVSIQ